MRLRQWVEELSEFFEQRSIRPTRAVLICLLYAAHKVWQIDQRGDGDDETPLSKWDPIL